MPNFCPLLLAENEGMYFLTVVWALFWIMMLGVAQVRVYLWVVTVVRPPRVG